MEHGDQRLFGAIDAFLERVCWWIIGGGVAFLIWHIIRAGRLL